MNDFDQFAFDLAGLLELTNERATRLAEMLEDRINALAEKKASEALDREFNRGDYSGW